MKGKLIGWKASLHRERQKTRRNKKISLQTRINTLNGSDPGTDFNRLRKTGVKQLEECLRSLEEQQPQAPVGGSSRQAATEAGSDMAMEVFEEEGVGSSRMGQSLPTEEQVDWAGMQQGIDGMFYSVWTEVD
ncbi:hypothetical protein L198_05650 [Cryptococcus wingfieldii CBS 7118]|uniref:Uncharacterized protein n=1 Tax=Cryptococcus wingfieldii CBS 7118 TaxID=1295528 RepID=A0A1E3IW56_9TREE|nr:hypothetical protein L198_05650 [Cryptococcus wingfieldii CBS 7118]ODN92853.1 hypothetical protein L198_05650 [Cryptococcus wingfieldii CBS 7118]